MEGLIMEITQAIAWLEEAARYFENRITNGEDMTHWSNVKNAENARKIAEMIQEMCIEQT